MIRRKDRGSLTGRILGAAVSSALIAGTSGLEGCVSHSYKNTINNPGVSVYEGRMGLGSATAYISTCNEVNFKNSYPAYLHPVYLGRKDLFIEGEKVSIVFVTDGMNYHGLRYKLLRNGELFDEKKIKEAFVWLSFPYDSLPDGDYAAIFHSKEEFRGKKEFKVVDSNGQ